MYNMRPSVCKSGLLLSLSGGHLINKLRLTKKRLAETRLHRPHVSRSSITPSRPKQLLLRFVHPVCPLCEGIGDHAVLFSMLFGKESSFGETSTFELSC